MEYRRRDKSNTTDQSSDAGSTQEEPGLGLETATVAGVGISLLGSLVQFIGLRGLNWAASIAQLGPVIITTIIRAWVRRGLAEPPSSTHLMPTFELDWFALTLGHLSKAPWWEPEVGKNTSESTNEAENNPKR